MFNHQTSALLADPVWPGVWRGDQLENTGGMVTSSGHPALDAALPGGGWPQGALIELLHSGGCLPEWRLLLPTLRAVAAERPVLVVAPPHRPHLSALAAQGLPAQRLWLAEARTPALALWSAEQALRCPDLGALLVWLPQAQPEQLRRLHLAAQASGTPLCFAWRPLEASASASPAPLRLAVRSLGTNGLRLDMLKRRGPPMERPIMLPASLPVQRLLVGMPVPADTGANVYPIGGHSRPNAHVVDRFRPRTGTGWRTCA